MANTKKKVVIIEDDDHVSRVYDIKLKMENIDTVIAKDGEEGIKTVFAEKPDLVLLDLMIPKKDGFAVLEEIKKNPDFKNTPVFILSNLGQQSDVDKVMELGAAEHMIKANYSIKQIISKVKEYLKM